jgi:hypothetical protein
MNGSFVGHHAHAVQATTRPSQWNTLTFARLKVLLACGALLSGVVAFHLGGYGAAKLHTYHQEASGTMPCERGTVSGMLITFYQQSVEAVGAHATQLN